MEQCQAKKILFKNSEVIASPYLGAADTAYDLSDQNWVNGIAIRWAGFFIRDSAQEQARFTPGKNIKFSDGSIRTITQAKPIGAFLEIYLDGSPLKGDAVGFPKKIRIVEHSEDRASNTTYNLTDQNWINGIAIHRAGFFVDNTAANIAELTPGKKIRFADGSERVIAKQVQNGFFLNIDLSGTPLDGAKVGYPKKFKVQK